MAANAVMGLCPRAFRPAGRQGQCLPGTICEASPKSSIATRGLRIGYDFPGADDRLTLCCASVAVYHEVSSHSQLTEPKRGSKALEAIKGSGSSPTPEKAIRATTFQLSRCSASGHDCHGLVKSQRLLGFATEPNALDVYHSGPDSGLIIGDLQKSHWNGGDVHTHDFGCGLNCPLGGFGVKAPARLFELGRRRPRRYWPNRAT